MGWSGAFSASGLAALADSLGLVGAELALSVALVLLLLVVEARSGGDNPATLLARQESYVRWPCYYALLLGYLERLRELRVARQLDWSPFLVDTDAPAPAPAALGRTAAAE